MDRHVEIQSTEMSQCHSSSVDSTISTGKGMVKVTLSLLMQILKALQPSLPFSERIPRQINRVLFTKPVCRLPLRSIFISMMVGSSMVTDILLEPYLMEFYLTMVGVSVFSLRSKVPEPSLPMACSTSVSQWPRLLLKMVLPAWIY